MTDKKAPMVRVGDNWVPAHRVWGIVEAMNTAADLVEKHNGNRPELTTEITRDVVGTVRERIRGMALEMGGPEALKAAAVAAGVASPDAPVPGGTGIADDEDGHGSTEITGKPDAPDGHKLPDDDFAAAARQLLGAMSVEEALQMLRNDYDSEVDIAGLVALAGDDLYLGALRREALEFKANMIAPGQIAELWNDSQYPPPSGNLWTEEEVKQLLGE